MLKVKHIHNSVSGRGGPPGYLANLSQALRASGSEAEVSISVERFNLLSNVLPCVTAGRGLPPVLLEYVGDSNRSHISQLMIDWLVGMHRTMSGIGPSDYDRIFDCDLLVVHNIFAAGRLFELWPRETKEKVVLMTHSPTFLSYEMASELVPRATEADLGSDSFISGVVNYEVYVMAAVRAVLWPCPQALEGYADLWGPLSSASFRSVYALTCTSQPKTNTKAINALRCSWGIEDGQLVALFAGRPHRHKGFDRFLSMAQEAQKQADNKWIFVHAGSAPSNDFDAVPIRHVGHCGDPGSLYGAADVVLLPNRYSYFDLGALEALALGAPLCISRTGGHKYLLEVCSSIPEYPMSLERPADFLDNVRSRYVDDPRSSELERLSWQQHFALNHFVKYHATSMRDVISD